MIDLLTDLYHKQPISLIILFGAAGIVIGIIAWTLMQALAGRPLIELR
jgi:hypothetical protein